MNKRVKQYFSLIIAVLMLAVIILPMAKVYASYYMDGVQSDSTTVKVGMFLRPGYDHIQISSNIHSRVFCYPYGYKGEYVNNEEYFSEWSMSGQTASVPSCDKDNCAWEVKKITETDIYLQAVDAIDVKNLEDQSVFKGEKATFEVEATPKIEGTTLSYTWYKVVGESGSQLVQNGNATLEICESNTDMYIDGEKFYCQISDSYSLNYCTNVATLSIGDGYGITYKSNDGEETIKHDTKKYLKGNEVELDFTNIPTKENYEFAGWATKPNSEVATYKTAEDKLTMSAEEVILFAVWNLKKVEDTDTKTSISGKFNYGANMVITNIDETDDSYKKIQKEIKDSQEIIAAYDVKIVGGYEGKLQVVFSVEEKYNDKDVIVYHEKKDGTIESFAKKVDNGKVTVEVTELSPFVIATADSTINVAKETKNEETKNNTTVATAETNTTTSNVKTGDTVVMTASMIIVIIALANFVSKKYNVK